MDDPLPKTAQDHYAYKIINFHPSLDNIIMSILKRRCTPGMKKCKSDKWTNRYLSRPSLWATLIFRGEDTLSPISCFPNNSYEYFFSISICSLLGWNREGVTSVEKNWTLYPDLHVIKLIKVLLLLPATSTEVEQGTFFTWLRSTVSGKTKRFNNLSFTGSPQVRCKSALFKDHCQWINCKIWVKKTALWAW